MHLWDDQEERKRVHEDLNSRYSSSSNKERQDYILKMILVYLSALLMLAIAIDLFVNPDNNEDVANQAQSLIDSIKSK